jgi:hypothetical protein
MAAVIITPQYVDIEAPAITRALLRHIVRHGDVVGMDRRGRTVLRFELAAEPWLLDKLATLGAEEEDREDADPAEDEGG